MKKEIVELISRALVLLALLAPEFAPFTASATGTFHTYNLSNGNDVPVGKLAVSADGGTIYGTTEIGGNGYGTVFKLDPVSGDMKVLHTFGGQINSESDGTFPIGGVVLSSDGWLYGTTSSGGANGLGTVFAVSTNDNNMDGPYYNILHSFSNGLAPAGGTNITDGQHPWATVTITGGGGGIYYLCGTTRQGGASGDGTVFSMIAADGQEFYYNILHSFQGPSLLDGSYPAGDLIASVSFNTIWLYGTTECGGYTGYYGPPVPNNYGTVFAVSINGDSDGQDPSQYSLIYPFQGPGTVLFAYPAATGFLALGSYDGGYPMGGLVMIGNWLYGMTSGLQPAGLNSGPALPHGSFFGLQLNPSANPPAIAQNAGELEGFSGCSEAVSGNPEGDICVEYPPSTGIRGPIPGVVLGTTIYGGQGGGVGDGTVLEAKTDFSWLNPVSLPTNAIEPDGGVSFAYLRVQRPFGPNSYYTTEDYSFVGTTALGGAGGNNSGTVFEYNVVSGVFASPYLPVSVTWEDPPGLVLQSATSLYGPWTNIAGATSPYTNTSTAPRQFFRLMGSVTNLPTLAPYVGTLAVAAISNSTAALAGSVVPNGGNSTAWFQYGTNTSYGNFTALTFVNATNPTVITNSITGLTAFQTYHYQLFATNSAGSSSGGDVTFIVAPSAATLSYSFIDPTDVVLYGSVSPNGFGLDCYPNFQYGTTTNYDGVTSQGYVSATNAGPVLVTNIISGLAPGTTYHYQLEGVFIQDEPLGYYIANGGDLTFTTPAGPPIPVVVPNAQTDVAGDNANTYPFDIGLLGLSAMRYQQVYAASQFSATPTGGAYITAVAFRLPPDWFSFSNTLSSVRIDLSTTTNAPNGLSSTFASNVGTNDIEVFNGPLSLSSADIGNPPAFDILIPLTTPFFYNPSAGNLLLDVRNNGGGTTTAFDAVSSGEYMSRMYGNVSSSTGGADSDGLVTEFIFATP